VFPPDIRLRENDAGFRSHQFQMRHGAIRESPHANDLHDVQQAVRLSLRQGVSPLVNSALAGGLAGAGRLRHLPDRI
jgi:hypothetical protein